MCEDITVLVNSCDSYEDIWNPFFKLFKIYWPNCPYRIILNTESKTMKVDGLNVECFRFYPDRGGRIPYGKRMLRHLKEIETKYTLVLIDDFFLNDYVDDGEIRKCQKWMDENENIALFSFATNGDVHNRKSQRYEGYEKRPHVGEYKVNFQAALWRTSALIDSWRSHEDPWTWEIYATFRSFFSDTEYYSRCKDTRNPINYGAKYGEAWNIVAGLWCVESVDGNFKKNGIEIDYKKRGILEYDIKDLPRDHRRRTLKDEWLEIRSIGLGMWMYQYLWRLVRQIKKKMGKNVDADFYEYLYKKRG